MEQQNNTAIAVLVTVFVLILLLTGFGMIGFTSYGLSRTMQWMFGAGIGFIWIFMLVIPILIIIALVLFILWLIRQLQNPRRIEHGKKR